MCGKRCGLHGENQLFRVAEERLERSRREKIDDDYELDSTVFLEGDEPSRTAWCARHGLVVDGTTTTEDVREIVDRGNVHEITRRRRRALYRRRPRKRAPLSRRRLLRDVPRGVEADETRPASVLRVEAADREAASKAAEAARVAALPWFEREALLAGREPVRRAPSPPATAAPVSEDVPPGVAAATAAAEAAAAPSAKRPRSDDDGDGDDAKRARVEDPALDPKKLKRLKVEELRAALEGLGCDTEGTKPTLVERLVAARAASAAPEPVEMEAEPSPADAPAAAEPAANADAEIDPKKLKRWRVEELRAALEAVGASTEGHKPALVERLVAARTASGGAATEEEDAAAPAEPAPAPAADAETEPAPAPAPAPAPVPEPTPELDPKKLKRLKVEELRAALESLGRSTEGHKPALVERLVAARTASGGAAMEEEDAAAPAEPAPAPAADAETEPAPARPRPRPRPCPSPRRSSTRRSSSA